MPQRNPQFFRPPASPQPHPAEIALNRQLARKARRRSPPIVPNRILTVTPSTTTGGGSSVVPSPPPSSLPNRTDNEVLDSQIASTTITLAHVPLDPDELSLEVDGVRLIYNPPGGIVGTYISGVAANVVTLSAAFDTGTGGVQSLRASYDWGT